MENKFDWDNFSFFIGGREIKGIVPIKIVKPSYIQEIQYTSIDPFLGSTGFRKLYLRELHLN
jgi:hypothetical protein